MSEGWVLEYEGFVPDQEPLREALCTLGNGFFASRGAAEESHADGVHYPGTYINGGYNRLASRVAGKTIVNEDMVNLPNWLCLTFASGEGEWLDFGRWELLSYRQELHLRDGLLIRTFRVRDPHGRETAVESRRLVHMGKPHLAAIEYSVTPENWSGTLRIRSSLDGAVMNTGVPRYRQLNSQHLRTIQMGDMEPEGVYLHVQTSQSRFEVAEAARTRLFTEGRAAAPDVQTAEEGASVGQEFALDVEAGQTVTAEKIVSLYSSRDRVLTNVTENACLDVRRAGRFEDLLGGHRRAWGLLWRRFDVLVDTSKDFPIGGHSIQLALRLHIFHLLQTASLNTVGLDVSVPARGLHGEAYRGHYFWDEMYIFPFYNLRVPEITRSCLLYRYRRLDMARALASEMGLRGAMYPWNSGSDGREETQLIHLNPRSGQWGPDHSRLQRHVNAACFYNVWRYVEVSGDRHFFACYGAEMMLEIARFWASLAAYNEDTGRYEIDGVMGPDEYHEKHPDAERGGLKNNAYTNVMAVWCLERALETLELLAEERREELREHLDLDEEELQRWREITRKMTVPFHGDGVISQFEGFGELQEFDWDGYRRRCGNIDRLDRILKAEGDSPDRYQVAKQADTCMLFYLFEPQEVQRLFEQLGYRLDEEMIRKNVDYYLRRTSHGSSLSYAAFASILTGIDEAQAWEFFLTVLRSDIEDIQGGTTPEGIHAAAMASSVNMVTHVHAGLQLTAEGVRLSPHLPEGIERIRFRAAYRGDWMSFDLTPSRTRIAVDQDALRPIPIWLSGQSHYVEPGKVREFKAA